MLSLVFDCTGFFASHVASPDFSVWARVCVRVYVCACVRAGKEYKLRDAVGLTFKRQAER